MALFSAFVQQVGARCFLRTHLICSICLFFCLFSGLSTRHTHTNCTILALNIFLYLKQFLFFISFNFKCSPCFLSVLRSPLTTTLLKTKKYSKLPPPTHTNNAYIHTYKNIVKIYTYIHTIADCSLSLCHTLSSYLDFVLLKCFWMLLQIKFLDTVLNWCVGGWLDDWMVAKDRCLAVLE